MPKDTKKLMDICNRLYSRGMADQLAGLCAQNDHRCYLTGYHETGGKAYENARDRHGWLDTMVGEVIEYINDRGSCTDLEELREALLRTGLQVVRIERPTPRIIDGGIKL